MSEIIKNKSGLLPVEEWPMMILTTDDWFYGPDGKQYKGVYGPVNIIQASVLLGFEPANSANWIVAVGLPGAENKQMILYGCRVHYAALCPERPEYFDINILDLSGGE